jgi:hypothetical protein
MTKRLQRQPAPLNEDLRMKTRYRATKGRPLDRELHLALAMARYRRWDEGLVQIHGPLYYRALRYTLH